LQMMMSRSCGRSTSEIRRLRNERPARIDPARRRNRLIPFVLATTGATRHSSSS
jgi:hypothetical protein